MIKAVVGKNVAGEELRWQLLTEEELVSLASTDALFGGAQTFVLEGALYGERGEEFVDLLEVFAESPHTFIFKEEKLLKAETEALKKAGAKIELEKKAEKKEYRFDNFGVAEALGKKDKKGLWLALMASWREGEKPEAVAGLMAWKARQMKDIKLSRDLVCLYHDSHRGAGELELLLERFALKL
ncbi:hypothetical protein A3A40_02380 [Candidatus Kaiserbacteria bacterium RIFCSPLOWO2_01_FULL_54_20]|uniref:DNA polymerase III delta N-terminal domain-containing protein n=1 Tax=Candidatus Kaiserbacteria bacterium RIFCSPLOWO2_01_FULL_54_20 TaxID=1798513 RepID=A0A1F6EJG4_9BACT|nr:MAG: hypothetical protein A3A40_02380 [Candidatus Kaiserbacteria bacterium RIFCSPLOWO2_01_FULL_54_20]